MTAPLNVAVVPLRQSPADYMNPAEMWQASEECFQAARWFRAQGDDATADCLASLSAEWADQACDRERELGIVREVH